jgi:5-methylcytosine-specific restriction protein A
MTSNIENLNIGIDNDPDHYSYATHKLTPSRSSKWPILRKRWLAIQPKCQSCGKTTKLEVHHIRPVHLYPELELAEDNLITLCENPVFNCHFTIAHNLNWLAYNPNIIEDSQLINKRIKERLYK